MISVYQQTTVSITCHDKNPTKRVGLVQTGPPHLIENELVLAMI
jgi:hypothetical protein